MTIAVLSSIFLAMAQVQGAPERFPPAAVGFRWQTLDESALRQRLIGRWVGPEESLAQIVVPYGEAFYTDGYWHGYVSDRGSSQFPGRWTIEGDRICVEGSRTPRACRDVWFEATTDRFLMRSLRAQPNSNPLIVLSSIPAPALSGHPAE